ncbi:lysophospholipid acyltransferase family protein [Maritalea sp.]|jgi:1-acyl-sn-glycerol-3-phosphate acyltransferase|uniref:lysophospholipid acyltransferase family protein n=1 Tax=Maritalea sp. TaxID=2003361 RepID=UPI0039E55102
MIWRIVFFVVVTIPLMLAIVLCQSIVLALKLKNWNFFPRLAHKLVCFNLGIKVIQIGKPASDKPTLLVSNHISWLDIPAIGSIVPISYVAKSEVGRWPIVGFLANLQKTIFVDRQKKTDTGRVAHEMGERMSDGRAVVLFAEGTSDIGLHVLPFRSALVGSTQAAMKNDHVSEMYIQPMVIAYTHLNGLPISAAERSKIAWIGDMGIEDNIGDILRVGTKSTTVMFGEPIAIARDDDRKMITKNAEEKVREMLVAINRQTPLPPAHLG